MAKESHNLFWIEILTAIPFCPCALGNWLLPFSFFLCKMDVLTQVRIE